LNPTWSKGFARKGAALHGARRYSQAIAAYEAGLAIEPNAAPLQKGLKEVKDAQENEEMATGDGSIGKMFSDPGLFAKLAANPKTASLLADRDFMQKVLRCSLSVLNLTTDMSTLYSASTNATKPTSRSTVSSFSPSLPRIPSHSPPRVAFQDPRMIQVLGVLMGIDMQGFAREEGSNDLPEGIVPMDTSPPSSPPRPTPKPTPTTSFTAPPPSKSAPPPDTKMEEPEEEEEDDDAKAKKEAEEEKKKGNEAYKARNFDEAEKHFEKAWEIWPKDITFLTNLAGEPLFHDWFADGETHALKSCLFREGRL
jgi:stress-induced-phosphoprotein 1